MYDLEEQEQIDAIKQWWRRHGKTVMLVALFAAIGLAAGFGYRHYQDGQSAKASAMYAELVKGDQDLQKLRGEATLLINTYPKTAYAPRAALILARAAFEANQNNEAKIQLNWVIANADESELQDIARLRLARILFDEKKYSDAVAALDVKHGDAFEGLYADLKGDIFRAQNNASQAKSAYVIALAKTQPNSPYRNLIQIKLDSLGEGK